MIRSDTLAKRWVQVAKKEKVECGKKRRETTERRRRRERSSGLGQTDLGNEVAAVCRYLEDKSSLAKA